MAATISDATISELISESSSTSFAPYLIEQDYAAYTQDEHEVWAELVSRRMPQLADHAAEEYLDGFSSLGLRSDRLPNLNEISQRLRSRTGWSTVPVSGFMPGPAFFAMLAGRQFPTTTWLRKRDSLEYTPEPDIFHDVFGHVPMHAHPVFADFLAHYGELCAGIESEAVLERVGRLFWYTVEFGLIRQKGRVKVYGSGLISSNGECTNVLEGRCEVRDFSVEAVLNAPVQVDQMHTALFAIESFEQIYEALQQVSNDIAAGRIA
ncbi:phenylalanine 4-monooxygenase [Acidicapsa ligni]|uniref:phenylalanine 4-monooxygenase n=1 Tax=Acidicapsa ligni TaxID=542300 RepID=UPI0021E0B690|nr:phenylalanine 4-monooxygenase [Acidicapsa ligni]